MKFWLIFMIFSNEGEFIQKTTTHVKDKQACVIEAAKKSAKYVNTGALTSSWCVTNDHYYGYKQDKNIPYD